MKKQRPTYEEFIALARRGVADDEFAGPPGFATRVASRGMGAPPGPGWLALWERAVSWGASATLAACLLAFWICRDDFTATARAADSFAVFAGLDEDSGGDAH